MAASPERTCVGCGSRAEQNSLLRLAAGPRGSLGPLQKASHRGRSAYLHRRTDCAAAMIKNKLIDRSLRLRPSRSEKERLAKLILEQLEPSTGLL